MSAASDAINTLNSQYYNALVAGLNLDPTQFQLVQGATPVGTTSENLWKFFDSIPPASVSQLYNPSQLNSFSQVYGGVISALIAQGQGQFASDMGDYYTAWNKYKTSVTPVPTSALGWVSVFQAWANQNLPQSQVQTCTTDFMNMLEDPIAVAANMWFALQLAAQNPKVCAYTTTIAQLRQLIANAPGKSVQMNSATESSSLSHTWAKVEASGWFDIFAGEGSSSYDNWTTAIATSGLDLSVTFGKVVTLAASPLMQPSSDITLQNYTPWFNSAALGEGYADKSNNTWKAGSSISWASTFGPSGNLQRLSSALVIVDGIDLTVTSSAEVATGDQQSFRAAAAAGFWPFFQASGSGGWETSTTFDDAGRVTVTSSCAQGNPQVLGVLVAPVTTLFQS